MTKPRAFPIELVVDLAAEIVQKGGLFSFYSRGFSMLPDIGDQEKVTVQSTEFCEVKIGDVLLCRTNDVPVLHRVLHKSYRVGETFLLLGSDAGEQLHRVGSKDVVGRVIDVQRSKKRLLKWHLVQIARLAFGRSSLVVHPPGQRKPQYKSFQSPTSYSL